MARYDYDLFVIGAGSGGVRAARIAAEHGARVGICEESRVGGTCVIRGCIPKKLLVYASHFARDFEDARAYGWGPTASKFDWSQLIDNKNREIDRLNGIYLSLLSGAGVDLVETRGMLEDAHTIRLGARSITADKILIAVGGWPWMPDIPGIEHAISSNEALELRTRPDHIVIVGGGYIAVEFAGIFHGLGVETAEMIRAEHLLNGFDDDLREELGAQMRADGIEIVNRANPIAIEKTGAGYRVTADTGRIIETDLVMFATGRHPNTAGLGLEAVGVKTDRKGAVAVDANSRSSVENIYAIGDVTNRLALTPVAIREGHAFADTVFGGKPWQADHADVPTAVFSQPPIGTAGLTEAAARAQHGTVDIYKSRFRPLKHTLTGRNEFTLMKLVVDPANGRVLGAHMIGADAPEIAQGLGIAIKMGATKAQFDATVGIHPTAAEEFVTMRTHA
ncbi:MAG: glutathione-disulfide reductase [Alphaproteobacteria bacterium]|nr:glutathione-disulfide reductase [Alphaproteobacteria bacterium]